LFAEVLSSTLRSEDAVGRFGGEEFLLILPRTCLDYAVVLAKRIQERLATSLEQEDKHAFGHFTVSGGIAYYPNDGKSMESLFEAADKALYQAKEAGRNCVRLADTTRSDK